MKKDVVFHTLWLMKESAQMGRLKFWKSDYTKLVINLSKRIVSKQNKNDCIVKNHSYLFIKLDLWKNISLLRYIISKGRPKWADRGNLYLLINTCFLQIEVKLTYCSSFKTCTFLTCAFSLVLRCILLIGESARLIFADFNHFPRLLTLCLLKRHEYFCIKDNISLAPTCLQLYASSLNGLKDKNTILRKVATCALETMKIY